MNITDLPFDCVVVISNFFETSKTIYSLILSCRFFHSIFFNNEVGSMCCENVRFCVNLLAAKSIARAFLKNTGLVFPFVRKISLDCKGVKNIRYLEIVTGGRFPNVFDVKVVDYGGLEERGWHRNHSKENRYDKRVFLLFQKIAEFQKIFSLDLSSLSSPPVGSLRDTQLKDKIRKLKISWGKGKGFLKIIHVLSNLEKLSFSRCEITFSTDYFSQKLNFAFDWSQAVLPISLKVLEVNWIRLRKPNTSQRCSFNSNAIEYFKSFSSQRNISFKICPCGSERKFDELTIRKSKIIDETLQGIEVFCRTCKFNVDVILPLKNQPSSPVEVFGVETVGDFKRRIENRLSFPVDQQRLYFYGSGEMANEKTQAYEAFSMCNHPISAMLLLKRGNFLPVFVKEIGGKLCSVDTFSEDSEEDLRKIIDLMGVVGIDDQRLTIEGRNIESGKTVGENKVRQFSTISLFTGFGDKFSVKNT